MVETDHVAVDEERKYMTWTRYYGRMETKESFTFHSTLIKQHKVQYKVSTISAAYIKSWHNSNITCSQDIPDSIPELGTSYLNWNDFSFSSVLQKKF